MNFLFKKFVNIYINNYNNVKIVFTNYYNLIKTINFKIKKL